MELENSVVLLNKTNKIIVILYLVLFVGIFTALISIDSSLDRPFGAVNLAPLELSTISYSKIFDVDREIIFNTFADFKNYPLILPKNVISVNNIPEKQSVYDISLAEMGIKTKLKAEHIIEPYSKQVVKVVDGDAQGTTITQTFESHDGKTKISIEVDLKTRGILTPFSFLPIQNANHAIDTIVTTFVDYSTRSHTQNEKIIDDLYREILLRPADSQALIKYSTLLEEEKITIEEIRSELLNSEEHTLVNLKEISDLSEETKDSINELYNIILDRDVDTSGLQFFGSALENGNLSLHEITVQLITSDEFYSMADKRRDIDEMYKYNTYSQLVENLYYELYGENAPETFVLVHGIFLERGDFTLEEIKELFALCLTNPSPSQSEIASGCFDQVLLRP